MRWKLLQLAAFGSCGLLLTLLSAVLCAALAPVNQVDMVASRAEEIEWASGYALDGSSVWLAASATGPGFVREICWECAPQMCRPPIIDSVSWLASSVQGTIAGLWKDVPPKHVCENLTELLWDPNAERLSAGWPLPALRGCDVRRLDLRDWTLGPGRLRRPVMPLERHEILPIDARLGTHKIEFNLPIGPVWTGIAFDTALYTCATWLLVRLPGALRRVVRSRRGLCPTCAYRVGVSSVCTECGSLLGSWSAPPTG